MKKFLTVLLVIAVMFTFSFGSAFAASDTEPVYDALIEDAAGQVTAMANAAYPQAVKALTDTDAGTGVTDVDAEFWKTAAPVYQAKLATLIAAKTNEIKALYNSTTAGVVTAVKAWDLEDAVGAFAVAEGEDYTTDATAAVDAIPTTVADMVTAITSDPEVKLAAAKAFGKSKADDAIIALKGIDVTKYSQTVNETTKMSSRDMATAIINKAIADIEDLNFDAAEAVDQAQAGDNTVQTLLGSLGAFGTAVYNAETGVISSEAGSPSGALANFVCATDSTYDVSVYAIKSGTKYDGQDLVTVKSEEDDSNTLAAKKAVYIAKVASEYATYMAGANTAEKKAEGEAYKAGVTEIINAQKTVAALEAIFADEAAITAQKPVFGTSEYAADKVLIEKLEVIANKYIEEGFDADDINDIVAQAKVDAYKAAAAWAGYEKAEGDIKKAVASQFDSALVDAQVAAAEVALDAIVDADDYYEPEMTQVKALYENIIAELKGCISEDEINAVKRKYAVTANYDNPTGLSKIANKTAVKNAIKKTTTGAGSWTENATTVQAYGVFLNAGLDSTKDGYRDFYGAGWFAAGNTTIDQNALADFYAEAGARTTAEAYAMIGDAKAALEAVKTVAEVKTAAAAIEAQIAALPAATAITADDVAAVKAAWDAYNDFVEETGSDISATSKIALGKARTAATNAEKLAIAKAINEYDGKTVTAADEEAIRALLDRAADFNDNNDDATEFYNPAADVAVTALQGYLKTLRTEAKNAVEKAINALPITITEKDVAAVDAAKALYDAYVAKYTDYKTDLDDLYNTGHGFKANAAADFGTLKTDLTKAVKAAEEFKAEEMNEENAKAYVQDLKIAARSVKTSKGVKVTIKADVQKLQDAGYTVEYRFYRSTKSNAKYGTPKVVKKANTYLNTSGKKGTRYYYKAKLIVKNEKGEVVATTPLTQCLYATRTF